MKFQRTSLILVLLAALLGGFVYFSETRKSAQPEQAQSESKPIFDFKESDVQAITVQTSKQTVALEKDNSSQWIMQTPQKAPADEGTIAYLTTLLATAKSNQTIVVPVARQAEFGLTQPTATVDIKLANQKAHRLILGKPNFNRNFLYAVADPPTNAAQDQAVLLVPIEFQNATDRAIVDWKRDKPKPKPSPSPDASTSPSPTPQ